MDTPPPARPRDPGYHPEDPIAALATPWGESALAVIRLSGPGTLERLMRVFRGAADLRRAEGYTLHYGFLQDPATGERIDQVLVAVYRAPRSYTGEEGAEVTCHGSPVVVRRLLALLRSAGFRFAEPGEFTLRAFLNGKVDLTRAEAVNELIRARTDRARALAFSRLSGSIENSIRRIRDGLVGLAAGVELSLDYPEEESEEAPPPLSAADRWIGELERLAATYRIGRIIQEGLAVVIAGRTNAGKSTLFNRLLREDRAIVSETHGTTRDYLEGTIAVDGVPLRVYDTAGLRAAGGPLEREGMRRTGRLARSADLVLYLVDAGAGVRPEDEEFLASLAGPGPAVDGRESGSGPSQGGRGAARAKEGGSGPSQASASRPKVGRGRGAAEDTEVGGGRRPIRLWTKIDRHPAAAPEGYLPVSAKRGDGMEELARRLAEAALGGVSPPGGEAVIDSLRQKELLERARRALAGFRAGLAEGVPYDLLSVDLKEALDALGEITGEVTTADILERMFRDFCVGK